MLRDCSDVFQKRLWPCGSNPPIGDTDRIRRRRFEFCLTNQKCRPWGPVKDARARRVKLGTRKLNTLPKKWWNVTGWKTALSGCFEQRRLYLIGNIDGHEPVGRV